MNRCTTLAKLALLAFFSIAHAQTAPTSHWITDQDGFKTIDAAAVAGITSITAISKDFEYAGVVFEYKNEGESSPRYYFTQPITTQSDGAVGTFNIVTPKGSKIVALFHTHPYAPFNEYFSNADVETAEGMKWVSYVGVIGKDSLRTIKYEPGKTSTHYLKENRAAGKVSDGKPVIL
jgi:proteasome lid subunit RPN8/RPN11